MTGFALTAMVLATVGCPKDVGQIRWDDFSHSFNAAGKKMQVQGTIWDRDQNGRVSQNDLMKVESASANGDALGIDEVWVVLRGAVAKSFARRHKRIKSRLQARCESRFSVKGVPKMGSLNALGRYLRKQGGEVKLSKGEKLQADMVSWAVKICEGDRHIPEASLRKQLQKRGMRRSRGHGAGTIKRLARDTAKDYAMECAHLAVPKRLTFGE